MPADAGEPGRVARSVRLMHLSHCVITSVNRDDLEDGGSRIWAETIREVRRVNPLTTMETLIPDFNGKFDDIKRIIDAAPEVISHNLETVRRLTPFVRSRARYDTSLEVIRWISDSGITGKSGIMVGLGETEDEVIATMGDMIMAGCRVMTIGQYLQPSRKHLPVAAYITPQQFQKYRETGLKMGFRIVESGPLVRSSYHARKHVI